MPKEKTDGKKLKIVLTGKIPSANRYWRHGRRGNVNIVRTSKEAKAFKEYVKLSYFSQNRGAARVMLEGSVKIKIFWFCSAKCNGGDLDNKIKILLDAMEGCVYRNDNQVVKIESSKIMHSGVNVLIVEAEEVDPENLFVPEWAAEIAKSLRKEL